MSSSESAKALWASPEYRAKQVAAARAKVTPEYKRQAAARMKAKWADPAYRERMRERARVSWAARRATRAVSVPARTSEPANDQPDAQVGSVAPVEVDDVDRTPQQIRPRSDRGATVRSEYRARRLADVRAARAAVRHKLRDGVLNVSTTLHYRCRRGHTWEYVRSARSPWSDTAAPCYAHCPYSEWQNAYFPAEHPTRAGEVEQRVPPVLAQVFGRP